MSKQNSSNLNTQLIEQKCAYILEDLERIHKLLQESSYEAIMNDDIKSAVAERWIERVINRCIDINLHIIRAAGEKTPPSYADSFDILVKMNVIDHELAEATKPCIGTRNILVHEYDDLNSMQFYAALQNSVKLFPRYIQTIQTYLESMK
ncbi:MAG: DUF86 domain-containing protein [Candidatus Kerfeldbacteria bacterium]|nr:DUF86 domain-containing protein [Candidatus Kerfeldbacteria bacterium]